MYKRILVPVDGSDTSWTALAHAARLAAERHAELRVIYVVDEGRIGEVEEVSGHDALTRVMLQQGEQILKRAQEEALKLGVEPGSTELIHIRSGWVASAIVDDARGWGPISSQWAPMGAAASAACCWAAWPKAWCMPPKRLSCWCGARRAIWPRYWNRSQLIQPALGEKSNCQHR